MKSIPVGLILLAAGCLHAADYFVDTGSRGGPADDKNPGSLAQPWQTLNRAAQAAEIKPGDTIHVREGVYTETMVVHVSGSEKAPVTIKAYKDEKPVIDGEGRRPYGIIFPKTMAVEFRYDNPVINASPLFCHPGTAPDHVSVEGLALRNFDCADPLSVAIYADRRTGIKLSGLDVTGAMFGIWLYGCEDSGIVGNDVHHCLSHSVLLTSCARISVAGNRVHDTTGKLGDGIRTEAYGYGCSTVIRASAVKVEPHGRGLAKITIDQAIYKATILPGGQNDEGTVARPGLVVLFEGAPAVSEGGITGHEPAPNAPVIQGGTASLPDERPYFVLHNNPEWDHKPYSPDKKTWLFETGRARIEDVKKAKYLYVVDGTLRLDKMNRDIRIISNEVANIIRQGLNTHLVDGLFVKGNTVRDNGATGIQVESWCRNVWIEDNVFSANNRAYANETGIWLAATVGAVVQNNLVSEHQTGILLSHTAEVIVRRNTVFNNKAQHLFTAQYIASRERLEKKGKTLDEWRQVYQKRAAGILFSGGTHKLTTAPLGVSKCAIAHNTLYDNGVAGGSADGIVHGTAAYVSHRVGKNYFFNNLIQKHRSSYVVAVTESSPVLDGNIYGGEGPLVILYQTWNIEKLPALQIDEIKYTLSESKDFEKYRHATDNDRNSFVAEAALLDAPNGNFRLAPGSKAINQGIPLTRATRAGYGRQVPVDNIWFFSDGFRFSDGTVLADGDEIMVGQESARVLGLDRERSVLLVDRPISWREKHPVSYVFKGSAPDVGAFETE